MEPGEELVQAVEREVDEETGLAVEVAGPCYGFLTFYKGERLLAVSMACRPAGDPDAIRLEPGGPRRVAVGDRQEWEELAGARMSSWDPTDVKKATRAVAAVWEAEEDDTRRSLGPRPERVENPNMVSHMVATEAIMGALARRLGDEETRWRLAGLLHDLDAEQTAETMEVHATRTVQWLRDAGLDDEQVLHAILAHNPANGSTIDWPMDRALFSCDPLTGLITAAALIRPEKKLALVELKSLKKRFKEPSFAKGPAARTSSPARNSGWSWTSSWS